VSTVSLGSGYRHLERGEWELARSCFEETLRDDESAEALDGLGQALWWLKDVEAAIERRQRAFLLFRDQGKSERAARIAIWLSREYMSALGNHAAASGWLSRAQTLEDQIDSGNMRGWISLARSEQTLDVSAAALHAEGALRYARKSGDRDLEILALAQIGLTGLYLGNFDEGMRRFDEAMAAATAGEANDHQTFGEVCCKMVYGCEISGDVERMLQWAQVVDDFMRRNEHLPLLAFCGSCCAEMFTAAGHVAEAESELLKALAALEKAGQPARCVHPAARLAELRTLQGRLEEAEQLIEGYTHLPEGLRALINLRLAQSQPKAAIALTNKRLTQMGPDSLLSAPFLSLLTNAQLAPLLALSSNSPCLRGELSCTFLSSARKIGRYMVQVHGYRCRFGNG
jgi:tetratricopeptide (TPR) repeat protein